jgi:hypothetical protein
MKASSDLGQSITLAVLLAISSIGVILLMSFVGG